MVRASNRLTTAFSATGSTAALTCMRPSSWRILRRLISANGKPGTVAAMP